MLGRVRAVPLSWDARPLFVIRSSGHDVASACSDCFLEHSWELMESGVGSRESSLAYLLIRELKDSRQDNITLYIHVRDGNALAKPRIYSFDQGHLII